MDFPAIQAETPTGTRRASRPRTGARTNGLARRRSPRPRVRQQGSSVDAFASPLSVACDRKKIMLVGERPPRFVPIRSPSRGGLALGLQAREEFDEGRPKLLAPSL